VKLIGLSSQLRLTTDPGRDSNPAWSPDGRSIAFLRVLPKGRAALIMIPALSGPERKLAECYRPDLPFMNPSPAWSPDGKWLVIADKNLPEDPFALTLVSVSTGEKQRLTSPPARTIGDSDGAFSGDGRSLALVRTASFLASDLYLMALSADLKPKADPARLTSDNESRRIRLGHPMDERLCFRRASRRFEPLENRRFRAGGTATSGLCRRGSHRSLRHPTAPCL
jgi:dipeptidyl aminopeptidase/acylaminoacyl peptidase